VIAVLVATQSRDTGGVTKGAEAPDTIIVPAEENQKESAPAEESAEGAVGSATQSGDDATGAQTAPSQAATQKSGSGEELVVREATPAAPADAEAAEARQDERAQEAAASMRETLIAERQEEVDTKRAQLSEMEAMYAILVEKGDDEARIARYESLIEETKEEIEQLETEIERYEKERN